MKVGIKKEHLTEYIIKPVCIGLRKWSQSSENLLLGTCAQETLMGHYLVQLEGGPARGIYQHEKPTFICDIENYLAFNESESSLLCGMFSIPGLEYLKHQFDRLTYDLAFATAMARLHYARFPEPLPDPDDVLGLARYYKKYWNGAGERGGKATESQFIDNYERFVLQEL